MNKLAACSVCTVFLCSAKSIVLYSMQAIGIMFFLIIYDSCSGAANGHLFLHFIDFYV
ncbi:hypothetical protein HMPREF1548_01967 [Clostridium sp. KLE 1755]|nr:hypothetical protein HMPREF1548_01967 [Clostridium sp. KLE 1755]